MSDRQGNPFNPKVVLGLLGFGALVFIALLYFIGMGEPNREANNGGAHAMARSLTGYAAIVEYLEKNGDEVSIARDNSAFDEENLLILTPTHLSSEEEINRIIRDRRFSGPTIVVAPKWIALQLSLLQIDDAKEGWVGLASTRPPEWLPDMDALGEPEFASRDATTTFAGFGLDAAPPDGKQVQALDAGGLVPLVQDQSGSVLAGFVNDGYYPRLAEAAGVSVGVSEDDDPGYWPVIFVAEPDLLNNYGFADRQRAMIGSALIETSKDGFELPIVFDVTLNGLGGSMNLLTLAFTPPFLAATLCLILAALLVAWRAFHRFGPTLVEGRRIAFGKRQLVANSAALIQRAKRPHLLGEPYAAMMRERIAKALGLRTRGARGDVEAAIDSAIAQRFPNELPFSHRAVDMRQARGPKELLRAASALKDIERTIVKS